MSPPTSPSPATGPPSAPTSLAFLTIRLIGRLRAHHGGRLAEFGLSIPEANAMLHLQPGEPMPMRRLADLMAYDKSNLTGVMTKLQSRGLVERDGSTPDRRMRAMVLTPAGARLRERVDARLSTDSPLLAGLSAPEQREIETLLRKLDAAGGAGPVAAHGGD